MALFFLRPNSDGAAEKNHVPSRDATGLRVWPDRFQHHRYAQRIARRRRPAPVPIFFDHDTGQQTADTAKTVEPRRGFSVADYFAYQHRLFGLHKCVERLARTFALVFVCKFAQVNS